VSSAERVARSAGVCWDLQTRLSWITPPSAECIGRRKLSEGNIAFRFVSARRQTFRRERAGVCARAGFSGNYFAISLGEMPGVRAGKKIIHRGAKIYSPSKTFRHLRVTRLVTG
jgi:hypothetical protein